MCYFLCLWFISLTSWFLPFALTVLNISTSSQLTYALPADFRPPDSPQPTSPISYFPYFEDTYLAVAASLNGGNVLATFVAMLAAWMKDLGVYLVDVDSISVIGGTHLLRESALLLKSDTVAPSCHH